MVGGRAGRKRTEAGWGLVGWICGWAMGGPLGGGVVQWVSWSVGQLVGWLVGWLWEFVGGWGVMGGLARGWVCGMSGNNVVLLACK